VSRDDAFNISVQANGTVERLHPQIKESLLACQAVWLRVAGPLTTGLIGAFTCRLYWMLACVGSRSHVEFWLLMGWVLLL
jgi:hypothetical protein